MKEKEEVTTHNNNYSIHNVKKNDDEITESVSHTEKGVRKMPLLGIPNSMINYIFK